MSTLAQPILRAISLGLLLSTTCLSSQLTSIRPQQPITWLQLHVRCATVHPRATLLRSLPPRSEQLCDGHVVPLGVRKMDDRVVWLDQQQEVESSVPAKSQLGALDLTSGIPTWVDRSYLFRCAICETISPTDGLSTSPDYPYRLNATRRRSRRSDSPPIQTSLGHQYQYNATRRRSRRSDSPSIQTSLGHQYQHNAIRKRSRRSESSSIELSNDQRLERILSKEASKLLNESFALSEINYIMRTYSMDCPESFTYGKLFSLFSRIFVSPAAVITDGKEEIWSILQNLANVAFYAYLGDDEPVFHHRLNDMAMVSMGYSETEEDPATTYAFDRSNDSYNRFPASSEEFGYFLDKRFGFSIAVSKYAFIRNRKLTYLILPLNVAIKSMPAFGYPIYDIRFVYIALNQNYGVSDGPENVVMTFSPTVKQYDKLKTGCAYWSTLGSNWTIDGCSVDKDGLCDCDVASHYSESRSGGLYAIYKYSDTFLFNETNHSQITNITSNLTDSESTLNVYAASLNGLTMIPMKSASFEKVFPLVMRIVKMMNVLPSNDNITKITNAVVADIVTIVDNVEDVGVGRMRGEVDLVYGSLYIAVVMDDPKDHDKPASLSLFRDGQHTTSHNISYANNDTVYKKEIDFAFIFSEAFMRQNPKFGILMYPRNLGLRPQPKVPGRNIYYSRELQVVLKTQNNSNDHDVQTVDLYFKPLARDINVSIACASWDLEMEGWNHDVCYLVPESSPYACRCDISRGTYNTTVPGGEFTIYEYTSEDMCSSTKVDAIYSDALKNVPLNQTLRKSLEMLQSCTSVPLLGLQPKRIVVLVYVILVLDADFLYANADATTQVLQLLEVAMLDWDISGINFDFAFTTLKVAGGKEADVQDLKDLMSNAVLHAEPASSGETLASEVSVVSMTTNPDDTNQQYGFEFIRSSTLVKWVLSEHLNVTEMAQKATQISAVISRSVILQNSRIIFVLYPIDKKLLPKVESPFSIFNSRQIDIYLTPKSASNDTVEDQFVELFFKPTAYINAKVKKYCLYWSTVNQAWSGEGCTVDTKISSDVCRCNLSVHFEESRTAMRYIIYEYSEEINFSLKTVYTPQEFIFIVGSSLSMFGLAMIGITAYRFRRWREGMSNKMMMHLATSTILYQGFTLYRQTHNIFAASNQENIGFIVLTVFVHYTRLTHYFWMLIMSVLQLKRLLTMVGAADTPHLLLKVSIIAWGIPLVPIIALLTWNMKTHFSAPDLASHLALYLVPGAAITIINMFVLCLIVARICSCCGWGTTANMKRHGVSQRDLAMRRLKTTLLLFFLFGIPTAFEMFNGIGKQEEVVEYLFNITDPIQGFVMFLFFILFDPKSMRHWERAHPCLRSADYEDDYTTLGARPLKTIIYYPQTIRLRESADDQDDWLMGGNAMLLLGAPEKRERNHDLLDFLDEHLPDKQVSKSDDPEKVAKKSKKSSSDVKKPKSKSSKKNVDKSVADPKKKTSPKLQELSVKNLPAPSVPIDRPPSQVISATAVPNNLEIPSTTCQTSSTPNEMTSTPEITPEHAKITPAIMKNEPVQPQKCIPDTPDPPDCASAQPTLTFPLNSTGPYKNTIRSDTPDASTSTATPENVIPSSKRIETQTSKPVTSQDQPGTMVTPAACELHSEVSPVEQKSLDPGAHDQTARADSSVEEPTMRAQLPMTPSFKKQLNDILSARPFPKISEPSAGASE